MSGLRVLVVDDEPLARQMVAALARADEDVAAVVECADATRAAAAVAELDPHIVLLDVEMPELDGIQIAERLSADGPVVVFITAHGSYAVEAFEVGAIDYLLKPFTDERFREALGRAKRRVSEKMLAQKASGLTTQPSADGAVLEFGDVILKTTEIVWIEAQDYYVRIHTAGARQLVRTTLSSLEERLDPATFLRVHRAAIVNLDAVRGSSDHGGGLRLTLSNGTAIPVSRSRRTVCLAAIGRRTA